MDRALDEITRRRGEDRLTLLAIAVEEARAAPAAEMRCQLPPEIDGVLKPRIDAVSAIGRMTVRGIAGNEEPPGAIGIRHRKAQVPEADMLELDVELGASRLEEMCLEVEIVPGRAGRYRCMEEPGR